MNYKSEVIIAGSGGQGQIFAATVLAEAAILEGKNVVQTQTYGIAQRGGFSSAEVIIAEDEILYHQVETPDMIIVLNESAVGRYANTAATVIYDNSLIQDGKGTNWHGLPFAKIAGEIGDVKVANLVAVGAMLAMSSIVSYDSIVSAIRKKFSAAVAEKNVAAISSGIKAVEKSVKRTG